MKNLRTFLLVFLISLTFFFNIERWDFGRENIIDIDSLVYILGFVAIISVIVLPVLRNSKAYVSITVWGVIYFVAKLVALNFFSGRPLIGGIFTYLSITELALLLLIVWLTHKLTSTLNDFEESVERITFADSGGRIRQLQDAEEEVQVEMYRSRHYHRPLSVIIIEPEVDAIEATLHLAVQEVQQAMMRSYVINNMAHMLSKYLRRTDVILEQRDRGRFMVLCPETNIEDSKQLAEYVKYVATQQAGISVTCGIATFPDEALTFEEMVRYAESHVQQFSDEEEQPRTSSNGES